MDWLVFGLVLIGWACIVWAIDKAKNSIEEKINKKFEYLEESIDKRFDDLLDCVNGNDVDLIHRISDLYKYLKKDISEMQGKKSEKKVKKSPLK